MDTPPRINLPEQVYYNSTANTLEIWKPCRQYHLAPVKHIYGLAQDCGNSSAFALEFP